MKSKHLLQVNYTLLEEIREINQKLIDTVVDVSDEDSDSVAVASESGEGTVVKCSYTAVALSQDLRAQFASAQMVSIKMDRKETFSRCLSLRSKNKNKKIGVSLCILH